MKTFPLGSPDRRVPFSVLFIALTLVALAVVPLWSARRVTMAEDEILERVEPARDLSADLAALHVRQMSAFQEYMLSGSNAARDRYRRLVEEEGALAERLRVLLDGVDLRIRMLFLPVRRAATDWQVGHIAALTGPAGRAAFQPMMAADRTRYERLVEASGELRGALNDEVQAARTRMNRARDRQMWITAILVLLALAGTVAVGRVARRLQIAIGESVDRQRDAVRSRREVDAILEATADGVLSVDLEGRVRRVNSSATALLGWTEEAARGRSVHTVLHGGDAEAETGHTEEACPVRTAVVEAQAVQGREGEVLPRGEEAAIPVLWSIRPLVDGLELRGAVLTVADLTEIKEAEARLRRAVQAREETMAVVSHDLRSPLGSISAAAELLLDVPLDAEKRRHHLELVRSATDRMERLIQDLLDVGRIDAGGFSIRPAPTAPGPVVERAVLGARSAADEKGISLRARVEDDLPVLPMDPDRILQVLENLIGNALRHTPRGGRIEVGVRSCGDGVRFHVEDDGRGIQPEHLAHLFDRFWRAERGGRDGAGLGLAIVKGIVEAHGGEVEVTSTPGAGSRFEFGIPEAPRG